LNRAGEEVAAAFFVFAGVEVLGFSGGSLDGVGISSHCYIVYSNKHNMKEADEWHITHFS